MEPMPSHIEVVALTALEFSRALAQVRDALTIAMWELERGNIETAAEQLREASGNLHRAVGGGDNA